LSQSFGVLIRAGVGKIRRVMSNPLSQIDPICQEIEIFHVSHVYNVEFETAGKNFFRALPGSVLDYEVNVHIGLGQA
jgi:hypothetical protein